MKRGNVLMIAFTLFIILCLAVRVGGEYPKWQTIISAISIASCFFAGADLFSKSATAINQFHATSSLFVKVASENLGTLRLIISDCNQKTEAMSHHVITKDLHSMDMVVDELCECVDECLSQSKMFTNNEKGFWRTSIVLEIIGYFLFLCIMTFEAVATVANNWQDSLTVLAFAVILIAQLLSSFFGDKLSKYTKTCETARAKSEQALVKMTEYQAKVDRYYSEVIQDAD